ncbi:hypothetical protein Ancab_006434 [Ancistrocladus abbreviatus]
MESDSSPSSPSEKKNYILRSSDNVEFVVEAKVASHSETIKRIIEDGCTGNLIPVPNVDGKTLAKVLEYCKKHSEDIPAAELKEWDNDTYLNEPYEVIMAVIVAANYLEMNELTNLTCMRIANTIRKMTVEQVREFFGIENDFTPEEEAKIREDHKWAHENIDKD